MPTKKATKVKKSFFTKKFIKDLVFVPDPLAELKNAEEYQEFFKNAIGDILGKGENDPIDHKEYFLLLVVLDQLKGKAWVPKLGYFVSPSLRSKPPLEGWKRPDNYKPPVEPPTPELDVKETLQRIQTMFKRFEFNHAEIEGMLKSVVGEYKAKKRQTFKKDLARILSEFYNYIVMPPTYINLVRRGRITEHVEESITKELVKDISRSNDRVDTTLVTNLKTIRESFPSLVSETPTEPSPSQVPNGKSSSSSSSSVPRNKTDKNLNVFFGNVDELVATLETNSPENDARYWERLLEQLKKVIPEDKTQQDQGEGEDGSE